MFKILVIFEKKVLMVKKYKTVKKMDFHNKYNYYFFYTFKNFKFLKLDIKKKNLDIDFGLFQILFPTI